MSCCRLLGTAHIIVTLVDSRAEYGLLQLARKVHLVQILVITAEVLLSIMTCLVIAVISLSSRVLGHLITALLVTILNTGNFDKHK